MHEGSSLQLAVKRGQDVIDAMRFSCVSPVGTVFAPTGIEMIVPVVTILAYDVEANELDTSRRTMRTHTRKWQISSEDNARFLRLVSETLDDQVAAAVANVSGRS